MKNQNRKCKKRMTYRRSVLGVVLVLSLVLGNLSHLQLTYANVQIPVESVTVEDVHYVMGEDVATGQPIIRPTMSVRWQNPSNWAPDPNPAQVHAPEFYEVIAYNLTKNKDTETKIKAGTPEATNRFFKLHEKLPLEAGSLYKVAIRPRHHHVVNGLPVLAPNTGLDEYAYAITDVQVNFESKEDEITVVWDDLGVPDFEYRIVYAMGDYSTKAQSTFLNNKAGEVIGLTSSTSGVTAYYDPVARRKKLKYTIKENIYPGQVYSVMVEPVVDNYKGRPVTRNRNYNVINNVSTTIRLKYVEEGDNLRLQWRIPDSFKVDQGQSKYSLVETRLVAIDDGQEKNIAILDEEAGTIGYYLLKKPKKETKYQLKLVYKAVNNASKPPIKPVSNILTYSPIDTPIQPVKPVIPNFFSKAILKNLQAQYTVNKVRDILADEYLVSGDYYSGDLDKLFEAKRTYHLDAEKGELSLVWSAFRRIDINNTSPTYGKYITDLNVYYDVWITDRYNALAGASRVGEDLRYGNSDVDSLIKNSVGSVIGFRHSFLEYYDSETGQLIPFVPNQVYYLKLVAKKKVGNKMLVSEPTIVSFYYNDKGDSFAPPVITKPPLREIAEKTTTEEITVAWREQWWEVMDMTASAGTPLSEWAREVWLAADGSLSTEAVEGASYFPVYKSESEIDKLQTAINQNPNISLNLVRRPVDLGKDAFGQSNVGYDFVRLPYADVEKKIEQMQLTDPTYSFKNYFHDLLEKDKNGTQTLSWKGIKPTIDNDYPAELLHKETGLEPNTAYLFILNPYRQLAGDKRRYAHYPTPIVVTTRPDGTPVDPDPTVPQIYVIDTTDMTATLSWKYNADFKYEIRYSKKDDVTKADKVEYTIPIDPTDPNYPVNGDYYQIVAKDLFPETGYYFYIKAIRESTGKESAWSNPAFAMTKPIKAPRAPLGLGVAALSRIDKYGYKQAVTEKSIAFEWLKLPEDKPENNNGAKIKKYYSYLIEVSDNSKFIDPIYIVSDDAQSQVPDKVKLLEKTLVMADGLISGRDYYIRVKTRLRVVGDNREISKESDYCLPIRITTKFQSDEYDGDKDPSLEILPSKDYELIYQPVIKKLTYRFRSDKKDASGAADNRVDQRLISRLIKNNTYRYSIDVSRFKNKVIRRREIIIPYTVMEAFAKHQVILSIKAEPGTIDLPANALIGQMDELKKQTGQAPFIVINLDDFDSLLNQLGEQKYGLSVRGKPQLLAVRAFNKQRQQAFNYLEKPMTVRLKIDHRYTTSQNRPIVYLLNKQQQISRPTSRYDVADASLVFTTKNIGGYGLFSTKAGDIGRRSNQLPNHWSAPFKTKVDAYYTVTGLSDYNPNRVIDRQVAYNGMYHLIKDERTVVINQPLSMNQQRILNYGRVMPEGVSLSSGLPKAEGITAFVRAYELSNGQPIAYDKKKVNRLIKKEKLSTKLAIGLVKAEKIGLISDSFKSQPRRQMTYGEYFTLWARTKGW